MIEGLIAILLGTLVGAVLATPVALWLTAMLLGGYERPTRRAHIVVEHIHTVRMEHAAQPQVIDGTISSQWPTRAMVAASWHTGVQIGGQE